MAPQGPIVYTPQRVKELAESLATFFDSTESLYFETWAAAEKIHMRQVRRLVEADAEFAETVGRCEMIQASRLLEGSTRPLTNTGNRTIYPVNPRIASLVLAVKHGFKTQQEIAISEACDGPRLDSLEACDEAIRQAQERKQQFQEMLDEARRVDSAVVGA